MRRSTRTPRRAARRCGPATVPHDPLTEPSWVFCVGGHAQTPCGRRWRRCRPPSPRAGVRERLDRRALEGVAFAARGRASAGSGCRAGASAAPARPRIGVRGAGSAGAGCATGTPPGAGRPAPGAARAAGRGRRARPEPGLDRRRVHPRGRGRSSPPPKIGPNPTDRGRPGTRRHLAARARGTPPGLEARAAPTAATASRRRPSRTSCRACAGAGGVPAIGRVPSMRTRPMTTVDVAPSAGPARSRRAPRAAASSARTAPAATAGSSSAPSPGRPAPDASPSAASAAPTSTGPSPRAPAPSSASTRSSGFVGGSQAARCRRIALRARAGHRSATPPSSAAHNRIALMPCRPMTTKIEGGPLEVPVAGDPPSEWVERFDRRPGDEGRFADGDLASARDEFRSKCHGRALHGYQAGRGASIGSRGRARPGWAM